MTVSIGTMNEVITAIDTVAAVIKVEYFGSVARVGEGNDLDIIVTVDPITYATWVAKMWSVMDRCDCGYCDTYRDHREERLNAFLEVVNFSPAERGWVKLALSQGSLADSLDLHVMPAGWRKRIDEIQQHLPHDDENFVSNIAREAQPFKFMHMSDGTRRARRRQIRKPEVFRPPVVDFTR